MNDFVSLCYSLMSGGVETVPIQYVNGSMYDSQPLHSLLCILKLIIERLLLTVFKIGHRNWYLMLFILIIIFLLMSRCANCFDCPSCGHTLSTRATSIQTPSPEDPSKTVARKVYYLACTSCRWTTRDVGLKDQTVG